MVSFGLLFYALCQYANADRNYYHYTNTRWMLIFLAIAFLMNYHEKQFINTISAIWLIVGIIGSVFYCNPMRADEKELLLARLTCGVVLTWGFLLIAILLECLSVKKSDWKKGIGFILSIKLRKINNRPCLLFCGFGLEY